MPFSASFDGEHQNEKGDCRSDADEAEQPETTDEEEDGEGGRESHSGDDEDAGDNDPERHLPNGRGFLIGHARGLVVSEHLYSPGVVAKPEGCGHANAHANAGVGRVFIVAIGASLLIELGGRGGRIRTAGLLAPNQAL